MNPLDDEIRQLARLYGEEIPQLYLALIAGPHRNDLRVKLRNALARLRTQEPLSLQEVIDIGNTVEQAREIVQGRRL